MPFVSTPTATFDPVTNAYRFTVPENAAAGTLIGHIRYDGGGAGTAYFSVRGTDRASVRLSSSGELTLATGVDLDFEGSQGRTSLSIDFSVIFFGTDGSFQSARTNGSGVAVTDIVEPPEIVITPEQQVFAEDIPAQTVIARIQDANLQAGEVSHALSGDHADLFSIVGREIVLTNPAGFDFETIGSSIELTVTTTLSRPDAPAIAPQTFSIQVGDVNEPITWSQPEFTFAIDENSGPGTIVGTVSATDGDGDRVTYRLVGDDAGLFEIDPSSGEITVAAGAALDFEAHQTAGTQLDVSVVATAPHRSGPPPSTSRKQIDITLRDLDEAPVLTLTNQVASIDEHAALDSAILTVTASDPDGDVTDIFVTGRNANLFTIVDNQLVVANPAALDFETLGNSVDLTLTAVSIHPGEDAKRVSQDVSVQLNDIPEPPAFADGSFSFTIAENRQGPVDLGSVLAVDPDGDTVTYQLTGPNAEKFTVGRDGTLRLREGQSLDFESIQGGSFELTVTAVSQGGSIASSAVKTAVIEVTDSPEPPEFRDQQGGVINAASAAIAENVAGGELMTLNVVNPDGDGDIDLFVTTHADKFYIDGNVLKLRDNISLDHERVAGGTMDIRVTASKGPNPLTDISHMIVTLTVQDVDEAPTVMSLSTASVDVSEFSSARKLADIMFTDDALGTNRGQVDDNDIFEVRNGTELWLKANAPLDFETAQQHRVTVNPDVTGTGDGPAPVEFVLSVTNGDDKPASMALSATSFRIDEGTATARKLADIGFADDGLGTNRGQVADNDIFEIRNGTELWLKEGAVLDFNTAQQHRVTINPDVTGTGDDPASVTFTLNVDEVDNKPTAMSLTSTGHNVGEDHSAALKLADIGFADDGLGTNRARIDDSDIFEIRNGTELWLKADAPLDFETAQQHQVTIHPDVTGIGDDPAPVTFTLNVGDVDEKSASMSLSGTIPSVSEFVSTPMKLADLTFNDDALGTNHALVEENDIFEIRNGTELWLKAGAPLDFETARQHHVTINPDVTGTGDDPGTLTFTLDVTNGDDVPTAMRLSRTSFSVQEGPARARKLADVTFTDDGLGTNAVTVSQSDIFEIRNGIELWLKADAPLDFETASRHRVTLTADVTGTGTAPAPLTFDLQVTNVDVAISDVTMGDSNRPGIVQASSRVGQKVGTVTTTVLPRAPVTYTIEGPDGQTYPYLSVRPNGDIVVADDLSDIGTTMDNLTIVARAGGEEVRQPYTVTINNLKVPTSTDFSLFEGRSITLTLSDIKRDEDKDTIEFHARPGTIRTERGSYKIAIKGRFVVEDGVFRNIRLDEITYTPVDGFVGTDRANVYASDANGFAGQVAIEFNVRPELEVQEGQSGVVTWDSMNLFESSRTAGMVVKFTRLPELGYFTIVGSGGRTERVTVDSVISAADIDAGRLRYTAPGNQPDALFETADFTVERIRRWGDKTVENGTFTIAIKDNSGGTVTGPTGSVPILPTLDTLEVKEGVQKTVKLDLDHYGRGGLTGITIQFTDLPSYGSFVLDQGGTQRTVTTSTVIRADDIAAGRLKYTATRSIDSFEETATYRVTKPVRGGQDQTFEARLDIRVRDFAIDQLFSVNDEFGSDATLPGTTGVEFFDFGTKPFFLVSGAEANRMLTFEVRESSKSLYRYFTLNDPDKGSYAPSHTKMATHVEKGGNHFIYLADYTSYRGVSAFSLVSENGVPKLKSTPGGVIGHDSADRFATQGIWTPTHVEFANTDFLVTGGTTDTGFSVFRIENSGGLTFIKTYRGSVSAQDGSSVTLAGAVHGIAADVGSRKFFVAALPDQDAVIVYRMHADGRMEFTHAMHDTSGLELDRPMLGDVLNIGSRTFIAMPGQNDDGVQIMELSSAGRLTSRARLRDSDNSKYELDGAGVAKAFTLNGSHYIAVAGFDDDGISFFRISSSGIPTFVGSITDSPTSNLDGADGIDFNRLDNGNLMMIVSGYHDDGFTMFELDANAIDDLASAAARLPDIA